MSRAQLRFQVDSRLATLLSQEYSSSERALITRGMPMPSTYRSLSRSH